MAATRVKVLALCFLGMLGLALTLVWWSEARGNEDRQSSKELYAIASGGVRAKVEKRRRAAATLAKRDGAEAWVVLLLLEPLVVPPEEDEARMRDWTMGHPFDLAVVAAAVDALPERSDPSVLLAVT